MSALEKHQSPTEAVSDFDDKKIVPPSVRDVDVGQMLEVDATPEEQRKVLWKLDFMYELSTHVRGCPVLMILE